MRVWARYKDWIDGLPLLLVAALSAAPTAIFAGIAAVFVHPPAQVIPLGIFFAASFAALGTGGSINRRAPDRQPLWRRRFVAWNRGLSPLGDAAVTTALYALGYLVASLLFHRWQPLWTWLVLYVVTVIFGVRQSFVRSRKTVIPPN